MTTQLKPSSWVLNDEPNLTTDQVWMVLAVAGQGGVRVLRDGVAIADTADQAFKAIEGHGWAPLFAVNETILNAQIFDAENAPADVVHNVFGQPGTFRYGCVFRNKDAQQPMRMKWVLAVSEQAARKAWHKLGEIEEPMAVFKLSDLTAMRDNVRGVRQQRGNGAMTDGREFQDRDKRWYELEAQKRPGGRAELDANARRLHALRLRVQAKRLAANEQKEPTP